MTQRDPHPDNDLIEALQEEATGGSTAQGSAGGGNLARDVGSRAEQMSVEGTLEGDEVERATGSDNPAQNDLTGDKTIDAMPTSPD